MHRDHWIPADDRTIVFRLFVCSLTPIASRLLRLFGFGPEGDIWGKWRVVGGWFLTPIASSPSTASGNLVSMESLVEYLFPSRYSGAEFSATYEQFHLPLFLSQHCLQSFLESGLASGVQSHV